jgi:hypothetical protein
MAGALDGDRQGTLLAGVAVGLAPVGNLAALVEAAAEALDVLVINDVVRREDGLLAAASAPSAEPAAATTTALAALATVTAIATWAVATRAVATITAIAITTRAITPGGTLGTGGEPGAGTLLATGTSLLACLRRISHVVGYSSSLARARRMAARHGGRSWSRRAYRVSRNSTWRRMVGSYFISSSRAVSFRLFFSVV